jgi:hypothetical protein
MSDDAVVATDRANDRSEYRLTGGCLGAVPGAASLHEP